MNTLKKTLSKDNLVPAAIALVVPAFLSMIGFGFYHGTFHMNANTNHCHENICHNH